MREAAALDRMWRGRREIAVDDRHVVMVVVMKGNGI